MNKNFEHYLLTCFNVDRGIDPENRRNSLNYLEPRLSLFESITVPSVINQSSSNFSWLVFFDIDTPEQCKKKIEYLAKIANFHPYYIKKYQETKTIIRQKLNPTTEYLVTTNLDNDDAIAEEFIAIIQDNLREEKLYFLNLLMGYMINDQGLFMREYYSSPFHTLSQKVTQDIISCLDVTHTYLYSLYKKGVSVYNIVTDPVWLQIVHDSNVRNKVETNAVPIFNQKPLNKFNIQNLPFDRDPFLNSNESKFSFTVNLFKKKKKRSLSFKMKLTLYTFFPQLTILYNRYRLQIQSAKEELNSNYSIQDLQKLIAEIQVEKRKK